MSIALLSLFCLAVATQVVAGQKEQQSETVYPMTPPIVYQEIFPCHACHRKAVKGVSNPTEKGKPFLRKYFRGPDPRPRMLVHMQQLPLIALRVENMLFWKLNFVNYYDKNKQKMAF